MKQAINKILIFLKTQKEMRRRKRVAQFMMNHALDSYFDWIKER